MSDTIGEENLGNAICALIRGDITCLDDVAPDKRPTTNGGRSAFSAVCYTLRTEAGRALRPWSPT